MAKKKDKNKIYFGLFIIFLMVSSSAGFLYSGDSNTKKINGHKFTKTNNGWETYIEQIESYWAFSYLPNELGYNVNDFDLSDSYVDIYAEGLDREYIDEFKFILLYKGIMVNEVNSIDCNKRTWVLNSEVSTTEISNEEGCLYLNGNINKFIDGLTYRIFGVI